MSFTTHNGTRGAGQPKGRLLKWMNKLMIRRILGGKDGKSLVLTTIGRKSGTERHNPVNFFPEKGDSWLIVASAAGAANNPAWYYNLAAYPDRVTAGIGRRTVPVTATQLEGTERDAAWQRITAASGRFAQYQEKTDRELPVIRLTAR